MVRERHAPTWAVDAPVSRRQIRCKDKSHNNTSDQHKGIGGGNLVNRSFGLFLGSGGMLIRGLIFLFFLGREV